MVHLVEAGLMVAHAMMRLEGRMLTVCWQVGRLLLLMFLVPVEELAD